MLGIYRIYTTQCTPATSSLITSLSDLFPTNNSEAALNIQLAFPVVLRRMQFFSSTSLEISAVENSCFLIADMW